MDQPSTAQAQPAPTRKKSWLPFILKWTIAIVGVFYIIKNISLHDRVLIEHPTTHQPVAVRLLEPATEESDTFVVKDTQGNRVGVPRSALYARSEYDKLVIQDGSSTRKVDVLGLKVGPKPSHATWPIVVVQPRNVVDKYLGRINGPVEHIEPSQVIGKYEVNVPYPLIDAGLINIVRGADRSLLLAAIMIFPLNFLITSYRWHLLMSAVGISVGAARAFKINMVGAFWNTIMPGTTGGDVAKAYYAAKHTTHRTRAVMSVVVDRVIGLLALVILGGAMATYQTLVAPDLTDPAARKCMQVAIGAAAILTATVLGALVLFNPALKRWTGLGLILRKLPMQATVTKMLDTLELYRRRPMLISSALAMSLPVHAIVVVSAMLACMAFHFNLPPWYYFVIVPVIGLAGAIPVSPQGAGVMEFFAILLTRRQGWTVSQAFTLTMSMRLVQVLWNLMAGFVVVRGGYHPPTAQEQAVALAPETPLAPTSAAS